MKFRKILPIIFSIVIIIGFIVKIGYIEIINSLNNVNKYYLAISAVVLFMAMVVKSIRWHFILKPLGINSKKISSGSYFIGQATNEILPTGSGELARLIILKKHTNKSLISFAPAIVLERFYDLFLLLLLSIFFAYSEESGIALLILLLIVVLVGLIFIKPELIIFPIRFVSFFENKNNLSKYAIFFKNKLIETQYGLCRYQNNSRLLFFIFILTVVSWIFLETFSHYLLLIGFGIKIPYLSLLGIVAISWILGTLSMLPGGLGAREVVYALMLVKFGVVLSMGLAIAMVYRGIVYLLFGSLAAISTVMLNRK